MTTNPPPLTADAGLNSIISSNIVKVVKTSTKGRFAVKADWEKAMRQFSPAEEDGGYAKIVQFGLKFLLLRYDKYGYERGREALDPECFVAEHKDGKLCWACLAELVGI